MMMPPTIMIGAATISVPAISTSICTCWTSLVVAGDQRRRAELLDLALARTLPTRWKIVARRSRPKPIAVRAPK